MKGGFVNDFLICTFYKMFLSEVRRIYKEQHVRWHGKA